MQRLLHLVVLLVCLPAALFATHNRAGEITYRHLGGYTYEFTVTTYTYIYSNANRSELPVVWGDGTTSVVPLNSPGHIVIANTDYYVNFYTASHTFPGPGVYEILMEDPNRNEGVNNIPNSVNTIFSIKTTMLIGSVVGSNNTPVLFNPPIDKAARGHLFIHNPGAYDSDGDSISYTITDCTGASGDPIEGYTRPAATDTLLIDEITGDLIWNTPANVGVYNIAIWVEEWRDGYRIGRIARDMQIDVYDTDNNPPVTPEIPDQCILAGDSLIISLHTTDADGDQMTQYLVGGAFHIDNPSVFEIDSSGRGWIDSHFKWVTTCAHARNQPYDFVLKTEDINDDIPLVDINSFKIRVLHKPPQNLVAMPGTDTVRLEWTETNCGTAAGYKIYRRLGSQPYQPDSCETGVPEYTGYEFLDYVTGGSTTFYRDDNLGNGLVPGYDYCYRITAYYGDGAESISSDEVCTTLIPGTPPILKVNVLSDDELSGQIELAWAVPHGAIDTIPGPFRYEVLRMLPNETSFSPITTIPTDDLLDTTYTDSGINTMIFPYTYSVTLYYFDNDSWIQMAGSETATSQYIEINGADNQLTLNMKKRAPWLNEQYNIYRENTEGVFMLIDSVYESVYIDSELINNQEYTYRTLGFGSRPLYGRNYLVQNNSHLATGIAVDTLSPCSVELFASSDCDSVIGFNELSWEVPVDTCANQDIIGYIVYSRDSLYGDYRVLDTLANNIFTFIDFPVGSIEQCYAVTAIDSLYNESQKIPFCVYNLCGLYQLPNVFTPNGDGVNDNYVSWNLNNYIQKVDMKIYNRYGKEIFTTSDPAIKWNGSFNDKLVATGVYYYICDVYEPRITGTAVVNLTGFIHVYSGDENGGAE
jgi:gliding motility-associated-like protein